MARGIGDPLVSAYARSYLCRVRGWVWSCTGCVSLTTKGSGGTAHTCSGRHSQYSCELLAWLAPGVALHGLWCCGAAMLLTRAAMLLTPPLSSGVGGSLCSSVSTSSPDAELHRLPSDILSSESSTATPSTCTHTLIILHCLVTKVNTSSYNMLQWFSRFLQY